MFKRRRKLYFHKRILEADQVGYYRAISDASLTSDILSIAKYYDLKVKKIHLEDFWDCKVVVKGEREAFLSFVNKLIKCCENYIDSIKF